MDNITQNQQIKAHLLSGRKLTSLEALHQFGCLRLSGRIHDLRKEGMKIQSETKTLDNKKRVAEYSISE